MVSFRGDYASKPLVKTLSSAHRSCHQIIFYALISTFWVSSFLMLALQAWPSWHSGYPLWPSFLVKLLWHPLPILPSYCSIQKLSFLPVTHSGSFRTVNGSSLSIQNCTLLLTMELPLPLPLEGSESSIFGESRGFQVALMWWLILERVPEKVMRVFRTWKQIQYKLCLW